ncbi:helix-turn-helix transcriptional regulator [Actinoplanes sp. Pm04-4]|uniref:Helix-turn-helix transcriptional regulator n=1 Tax=Paractinoplanes pyxinae TaxID=2997416 RepID=A0ABT4AVH5_9ACTN|nr:helix-turn-helix transcriptional regulator [Actinoplanes pyxinae]MCY1137430.1 helix-turn-helix transcriptional regulator [Actinoplanes pyxinae]
MAEGDSPVIARRRVRLALREAREAVPLTQAQVAEAMEWSLSKVIRIESGDVTISINDLRGVLSLLDVSDRAIVDSLVADARVSRIRPKVQPAWWMSPRFDDVLADALRQLLEYESEATAIRSFNLLFVPGPLQTPAYGAALTNPWVEELGDEFSQTRVQVLVEARQRRREALLARPGSFKYFILIDQSVLMRPIGGIEVFADQLRLIVELSSQAMFQIRMLPFDLSIAIANNGSFDLLTVGADAREGDVLYRENGVYDQLVENRAEVARHRDRFEQLWSAADSESDTITFIKKRMEALEKNSPEARG